MGNGFRRGAALVALAAALGFVGCGDPDTEDDRGFYTKAPLEKANLFVDGEEPAPVSELGEPIRIPRLLPDGRIAGPDEQEPAAEGQAPQPTQPAPQQDTGPPAATAPADTAA